VAHEVTNTTDKNQLCNMGKQAQAAIGIKEITVIADKGYYSSQDIVDPQDARMTPIVPKFNTSGNDKKGLLNKALFLYDTEKNVHIYPANEELTFRTKVKNKGLIYTTYYCSIKICRECPMKKKCSKSDGPRNIRHWERADRIDKMTGQLKAQPDSILIRKNTIEYPFGTTKFWMGATHLLTREFKGVSTETNCIFWHTTSNT
jgi:hypothetical protein